MDNHSDCGDASFEARKGKEDEVVDETLLLDDHLDSSGDHNVRRTTLPFSHYEKAFTYICENQETSIARGLALVHYMRGNELHSHYKNIPLSESARKLDNDRSLIDYHLTQAMIQFQRAWRYRAAECQEWKENLEVEWLSCAKLIWTHHCNHHEKSEQSFSSRIGRLEVLCKRTQGHYRGFFYFWLAKKVLKKATKLQAECDYRQSAQLLRENQPRFKEVKMTSNPDCIQDLHTKAEKLLNVADYWDEKLRQWELNKDRESLRELVRKELSVHLAELKDFDLRPAQQLLDLIYSKYPPKSPGLKKPEDTSMRSKLKKALLHYHPDKQNIDRFGLHWMVLAEEITVLLNRKLAT